MTIPNDLNARTPKHARALSIRERFLAFVHSEGAPRASAVRMRGVRTPVLCCCEGMTCTYRRSRFTLGVVVYRY